MWRHVAPAFEDRYRTVLFDHVGAGGSDLRAYDPAKYSDLSGYADDVVEIGNELGLKDAVFFRLGLGDDDAALKDAALFEKNYAKKNARETSQVIYSLASIYERQNDWQKVADHYQNYLKTGK